MALTMATIYFALKENYLFYIISGLSLAIIKEEGHFAILSILMVLVETVVDLVVLVTSMIIINSIINMIYSITLIKGKIYDAIMPVTKVTIILSSMLFASDNLLLLNAVIAVISILTVYYFHHVYIFLRYKVV